MASKKRAAPTTTPTPEAAEPAKGGLLESLRGANHKFTTSLNSMEMEIIPSTAPISKNVEYLLVNKATKRTPVFSITGTAITMNSDPFHALHNRSQSSTFKMDRYVVRLSVMPQDYATITANFELIKEMFISDKDAMHTIIESNHLLDPNHPSAENDNTVPVEVYGISKQDEVLFMKCVAGPIPTNKESALARYLPDPKNAQVLQLKRPTYFYLKPFIPLLHENNGETLLHPSVGLDKPVTAYFQIIQNAYNAKITLSPEIIAVTADPTAPEPACKIARNSLFI